MPTRAVPELALVAFMVAFVGVGLINLTIALLILGILPILTNTFAAIRQVDRDATSRRARDGDERCRSWPESSCRLRCRR